MKPVAGLLCCALLVCVCGGALAQGSVKDLIGLADVRERLTGVGAVASGSSPEELGTYFKSEVEKFGKIVRATGLKIE